MAEEDGIPPWVKYLTDEMNRRFDSLDTKMTQMVSRDAFREEQRRVNDKIDDLSRELGKNASDIQAEAGARVASELAAANAARVEAEKRQQVARQTSWQWFALLAAPVVVGIVSWVLAGGLAP